MAGLVTHFAITLTAKILHDLGSSDTLLRTKPKTTGVIRWRRSNEKARKYGESMRAERAGFCNMNRAFYPKGKYYRMFGLF